MARRIANFKALDSVDISSTKTSEKSNVSGMDEGVFLVNWSGTTPIGVLTVEASNSSVNDFRAGNEVWSELDFGVAINVTGNTGNHELNFTSLPFKWIRIIYTTTSGIGTMSAHFNATSLGA